MRILRCILPQVLLMATITHSSYANDAIVVTAHERASKAGVAILESGGSAVDAAVAVQSMLTLVEPQSSGIGGGGFMLYWSARDKKLYSYDGRETAPSKVDENLFYKNGSQLSWYKAAVGGVSVGVPGVLAMLKMAHDAHGELRWKKLFKDSIDAAKNGFTVDRQLHDAIIFEQNLPSKLGEIQSAGLKRYKNTRSYFFDENGKPLPVGTTIKNPQLAKTLTTIARKGTRSFYCGAIARSIVKAVNTAYLPGALSVKDMCQYRAVERTPICGNYRGNKVCGMGPPSSGGATVLMILGILENFDMSSSSATDLVGNHIYTQASRLAYADRNAHLADSDFVKIPLTEMLDKSYLAARAALIETDSDMGVAPAGINRAGKSSGKSSGIQAPFTSTSHFVIVDYEGNIVSMTASVEKGFGSTLMSRGLLLNNQLTDFSFASHDQLSNDKQGDDKQGVLIANRVQPGKRPRSSMSPTIIFTKDNQPAYALGSPGGSRIISYVAQAIVGLIDWRLSPDQAASMPHIVNRNTPTTEVEQGTKMEELTIGLKEFSHIVEPGALFSGLHIVSFTPSGLLGGADPRRQGVAIRSITKSHLAK